MLNNLHIENIALIVSCDIKFSQGLNILSGETGAGKSIIIDSINFILGARADKSLIRFNEKMARVEAEFTDINDKVKSAMAEIGLDAEDILIINRSMTVDGKSEIRINGRIVTQSMLKTVSVHLLDVVGQHENQFLLKNTYHLDLIDNFGGKSISDLKTKVKDLYVKYTELKEKLAFFGNSEDRLRRIDLLKYQIDEIKSAELKPDEEDELLNARKKIINTEKIVNSINSAISCIESENYSQSVITLLNNCNSTLNTITQYDKEIENLNQRIESCKIELKDVNDTLSSLLSFYEYDSDYAEKVEKRLDLIKLLKKKYGKNIDEINDYYDKISIEYNSLLKADEEMDKLNRDINKVSKDLYDNSLNLSNLRKENALVLEKQVFTELNELGMKGTTFKIVFNESTVFDDNIVFTPNGFDSAEFMISPNIGAPVMSLAKIISGGEMSRMMLAIKVITCRLEGIATVVFDEIDTGISGNIAQVVACKLYNVSKDRQVIAVTHLPQLCAMADNHYMIEKNSYDNTTKTIIIPLDNEKSVKEVARLIGGSDYSGFAIPHAKNMKDWSDNYKKTI